MKYQLFIGSSSEHINYAESVQLNIGKVDGIQATCWNQGIFQINHYPLEDLLTQLSKMSFGVFVLAPDDLVEIRGEKYNTVRDNVLFEMGMFLGALGRDRTFFIVPQNTNTQFRIPSDLAGLNNATYMWESSDDNIDSQIGAACTEIKRMLKKEMEKNILRGVVEKYGVFPEFDGLYKNLFQISKTVTTSFIHSRRWRESNLDSICNFLNKEGSHWDMLLPDVENEELIKMMKSHFSDGVTIVSMIIDAYMFCIENIKKYSDKLTVYLYTFYPTYSFYKFDNKIIVSLYPLTSERRPTPTLLFDLDADHNDFFEQEVLDLKTMSKKVSVIELNNLVEKYTQLYNVTP